MCRLTQKTSKIEVNRTYEVIVESRWEYSETKWQVLEIEKDGFIMSCP